jgi:hypothetical protein
MTSSRRPSPFAVIAGALGLFLVVFALLAFQLRAHARPALAAAPPTPVRRVLNRRILIRKVIVIVRSAAAPGPARVVESAPAVSGAPAAAPAPAPAPAPAAPLVSHTS